MKTSRLDRKHIKLLIAQGIANCHSQRQIAQALGTSQPTISRLAKKADVQKMIQEEDERLCIQIMETSEKIKNDPRFLAELQKMLEKQLLNFKAFL